MIEAPVLSDIASLDAILVRRTYPPVRAPSHSRALAVIDEAPVSSLGADLRFFAICYLAGFIFFLIMLS